MRRGAVKKKSSRLVPVWFPEVVITHIDDAVQKLDTDRSKFIRSAVREKMCRAGFVPQEP